MRFWAGLGFGALAVALGAPLGCGARSGLSERDETGGGGSVNVGGSVNGSVNGGGVNVGGGGDGGVGGAIPCESAETMVCGTNVGECQTGISECEDDVFGRCQGNIEPADEVCNGLDEDCDGVADNGFGVGEACDGPDSDECTDDIMTCDGCTLGGDDVEVCNGFDDNCNGVIDADCEMGDCQPALVVTGSTPSNPNCIDFPVEPGASGVIQYPCTGGPVSAVLSGIPFTGSVNNGFVNLTGTAIVIGPDNCTWQNNHAIFGDIPSGTLTYTYEEVLLTNPPINCWSPCTEIGDVDIEWQAN